MTGSGNNWKDVEPLLRGYLLDTLDAEDRRRVEQYLAESEACRAALERERQRLALLDALPAAVPPKGLAERAIERVREEREKERKREGTREPRFGWVTAILTLCIVGIVAATLLPALARAREAARRSSSQNNLKELGLVFKMYAQEDPGERFPPVSPYPGVWAPDFRVLYPEYLTDPAILINPSYGGVEGINEIKEALEKGDFERASRIAARNYTYTGWAIHDEKDVETIRKVLPTLSWDQLDRDITVDGHTVYRLREGIDRFFITDVNDAAAAAQAQSVLPVAFENVDLAELQHVPPGCNVLYLDGHIDFLRQGTGNFPVVPIVAETFPAPQVEP